MTTQAPERAHDTRCLCGNADCPGSQRRGRIDRIADAIREQLSVDGYQPSAVLNALYYATMPKTIAHRLDGREPDPADITLAIQRLAHHARPDADSEKAYRVWQTVNTHVMIVGNAVAGSFENGATAQAFCRALEALLPDGTPIKTVTVPHTPYYLPAPPIGGA